MKIAIVVDSLCAGGAERQAILCVSELRKRGHQADLVHYHPACEYQDMLRELELEPFYVQGENFGHRCRALKALFRARTYDVVHGFKMSAEVYAAFAGSWARVPHRFGCFRNLYNLGLNHRCVHFVVDKFLDGWIVNSQAIAESMSRATRISRHKIHVLRNGAADLTFTSSLSREQARSKFGFAPHKRVITMVGRLEPQKNYPMLLDAAREVVAHEPNAQFVICGKGSQEQVLKSAAAAQELQQAVTFLGYRPDVADLIAATDISVLTSDYEGLPNVIIEQMSAGKPIASTDYQGAREIMTHGETALLSPVRRPDLFAQNVLTLLRDESLRQKLGANARAYAKNEFSPEAMGRKLESIYLQYVDQRR